MIQVERCVGGIQLDGRKLKLVDGPFQLGAHTLRHGGGHIGEADETPRVLRHERGRAVVRCRAIGVKDVEHARPVDAGQIHGPHHGGGVVHHAEGVPAPDVAVKVDDLAAA